MQRDNPAIILLRGGGDLASGVALRLHRAGIKLIITELAQPLPMSLPAVVQHLQVLEGSGLVRSEKVGRVRTCSIEPVALRPVERWISARRTSWERRLDRLGEYLAEGADEPREGGTP